MIDDTVAMKPSAIRRRPDTRQKTSNAAMQSGNPPRPARALVKPTAEASENPDPEAAFTGSITNLKPTSVNSAITATTSSWPSQRARTGEFIGYSVKQFWQRKKAGPTDGARRN